jgi:hypothetical protein
MVDNLVRLLESFSAAAAPTSPLIGQLWWDSGERRLKIWANSTNDTSPGAGNWRNVGSSTVSTSPPNTTVAGDMWLNSSTNQFYVYDGTTPFNADGWILVGPGYDANNGKSTALWEQITDTQKYIMLLAFTLMVSERQ